MPVAEAGSRAMPIALREVNVPAVRSSIDVGTGQQRFNMTSGRLRLMCLRLLRLRLLIEAYPRCDSTRSSASGG